MLLLDLFFDFVARSFIMVYFFPYAAISKSSEY
jgi:hypothetical protein